MKKYVVNEIFYSPQGEGIRAGEMTVFVRMTGCNLRCSVEPGPLSPGGFDCDTEFESGRKMTAEQIHDEAKRLVGKPAEWYLEQQDASEPYIIFTGGEPGLQLDEALVMYLQDQGFRVGIETNGTVDVSPLGLDWITVSPKVAEHAVKQAEATEIKYVRGYGQAIPKPSCNAVYKLISPATSGLEFDHRAVAWCRQLIAENPEWRLTCQLHKVWNLR